MADSGREQDVQVYTIINYDMATDVNCYVRQVSGVSLIPNANSLALLKTN